MNCKASMFSLVHIRRFSSSNTLNKRKNHYDSLGIAKNATQVDVKSAYYNLSKVYHPDRNLGNQEHLQKFRDITEAYEVLGNIKTRKLYDKGFFSQPLHQTNTTVDPLHKFYKSREYRMKPPPPNGRVPIYDFDEWAKRHYGDTFEKTQDMKRRRASMSRMNKEYKNHQKMENLYFTCFIVIAICMFIKSVLLESDYDTVRIVAGSIVSGNPDVKND